MLSRLRDADLFSGANYRAAIAVAYLLPALMFGAMLRRDLGQIERGVDSIARERGSALFALVELARDWNALHGGVYVPVTDSTQPNPYLKVPRRDVTTTDGVAMTMVNPAFMTRQIAEIAARKAGVQLHITSLNPIRPANAADPWESETLASFNAGATERMSLVGEGETRVFRYMAPLWVKPPCMKCHEAQGYKVGDLRGGISVTMPAEQSLRVLNEQRTDAMFRAAGMFALVAGLLHLSLATSRRLVSHIKAINREQEATIALRTRDLAEANAGLAHEVDERRRQQHQLQLSETRYRAVVENATDGVFVADATGILYANRRLGEIVGYAPESLLGSDPLDMVCPVDLDAARQWQAARRDGHSALTAFRVRLCHPEVNRLVHVDLYATVLADEEMRRRVLVTVRDVTAELDAERESKIAAAVFESAAEAIIVTDSDGVILRVNPAFTAITGYTPREAEGNTPALLKSGRHAAEFYAAMWRALRLTGRWQGEVWNRRKSGETYIELLSITRIEAGAEHGGYVGTFTDITKRKEAEELMTHKAYHDALTDLPNRALFRDRLHAALALARRHHRQIGLLYIDLDLFKDVNDRLGHAAGDALLIEAASRLVAAVRDSDTVARLGGDEFAVVLAEVDQALEAEEVAQRIVDALARPFELREGQARISGSIGVALFPDHGGDAETLQKHADIALYAVKAGGRAGYRVYSPLLSGTS